MKITEEMVRRGADALYQTRYPRSNGRVHDRTHPSHKKFWFESEIVLRAALANTPNAEERDATRIALQELLDRYVGLVESGDCGSWNPENESVVQQARAALSAAQEPR